MTSPGRPPGVRFARWVFGASGVYGLALLLPQYLLEDRLNRDYPPAITHPEYFYGFLGVAVAWQVAFLLIARDPARHRPLMPAGVVEKFSFAGAAAVLMSQGRISTATFGFGMLDGLLGVLFLVAYFVTPAARAEGT
ncbi:MAG TPA: hypothetical protein VF170_04290 [Planctomycetaceae bacterium]